MELKVVEKFVSINGEGRYAGQPAVFIRFAGCNLNCSFCDTKWANEPEVSYEKVTPQELLQYVENTGITNVTLTGGEPLLQKGIRELLLKLLEDPSLKVEIETNGSVALEEFLPLRGQREDRLSFTMDYKLPFSEMEEQMHKENFSLLSKEDTVKFVAANQGDLERSKEIMMQYSLRGRCHLYISPVYGEIELKDIVDFLVENRLNNVNMQLQMHKFIWDPNQKGV